MGPSFSVGVDVGGTRLRVVARDPGTGESGEPLEVAVPRSVDAMVDVIDALARKATSDSSIGSIAIGLPGQVLDDECVWVPNLRFLDGVPLGDLVATRLGAPCHLINDAQATLVAEVAQGAARGLSDVLLVAVGTGIGGAFMVDGRLVRGANGCAGALGWLSFPGSARDADHGEWEQVGSGRSLDDRAAPWGGTQTFLDAARGGDESALRVVAEYGGVLGKGIAALASVLDPELVVFAGGLVTAFDLLHEPMSAALSIHGSPAGSRTPLAAAALGNAAGVLGALQWADEHRGPDSEEPWQR
jgi:predicted NBD/HSP70 family sugar kinase